MINRVARSLGLLSIPFAFLTAPTSAQTVPAFHLVEATVDGIHAAMSAGQLTCTQLVQGYLNRIAAYDQNGPKLNAIQNVNPNALKEAAELDATFKASGFVGPLHCIPVLVKDEVETSFMPTTYGSALFKNFTPQRNATVVDRLLAAGAIILAKTNLGEFAAAYSGSAFGDCHNAYDPTRSPSGSSCGSGIGLAANFAPLAIGEDTAGSIRGPASHASLVALRPTLPLVSRFGLLPSAPTRDTLGPMARTVRDTAIMLDAIAGYDPKDPVTAQSYGMVPKTYTSFLEPNGLSGMRFGVIRETMARDTDTSAPDYREIRAALDQAVRDMRSRGAELVDPIVIPRLRELIETSTVGTTYESEPAINAYFAQHPNAPVHTLKEIVDSGVVVQPRSSNLGRSIGHSTAEAGYLQELQAREALRTIVLQVMADNRLDALVYMTYDHAPAVVPVETHGNNRLLAAILAYPALAVPAGFLSDGLPVGVEFLGRPFSDGVLLTAGYDYEQTTRHRHPPATTPALPNEP
jgi:Asp-tRNA(Asn)/Glu-tRNA(Gln) amidotransferase A subunit family amidase